MIQRLLPQSPRLRSALLVVVVVALTALYTQLGLPGPKGAGARGTPMAIDFQGLIVGIGYGLGACLLVLVYRVQRFLDFASSTIGLVAGLFGGLLIRLTPTPFYVAVPAALLAGALLGATFELVFIRRFFDAPRLTLTVMTVVAAGALAGPVINDVLKLPFFPRIGTVDPAFLTDPVGPRLPFAGFHFTVGSLPLRFGFGAVFALWTAAVVVAGLLYFFRYTRTGTAARALAENSDRAELLGISTRRVSTVMWTVVGLVAASAALANLFSGVSGNIEGASVDQLVNALVVPLVAAVFARMESFATALFVAIVLEVLSSAAAYSYPGSNSVVTVALFLALCGALLVQRRSLLRSEARSAGGWAASAEVRAVPAELASVPTVRWARIVLVAASVALAALFPFFFSTRVSSLAGAAMLLGIVAMSLVVLTGWAGQISLGQVGFMAVGALVGGSLVSKVGIPFWFAVPIAAAVTAAVALVVGIPALRIRGLFLAAVTFAFGVTVNQFFFDPRYLKWLQPQAVSRPRLFFLDFADERSMYYLCLAGLVLAAVVVLNLRRSRFGRILIAMRDNEAGLQAVGISVVRTKLVAFMVSGALAGYAGAIFAAQQRGVSAGSFTSVGSLNLFAYTIVGGVTSVAGALLGQLAQFTLERGAVNNQIFTLVAAFVPLGVLYFVPSGLVGLLQVIRDAFLRVVAQRRQIVVPSLFADYDVEVLERRLIPLAPASAATANGGRRYRRQSRLYPGPPTRPGAEPEPVGQP